jgi:hypothetical protein
MDPEGVGVQSTNDNVQEIVAQEKAQEMAPAEDKAPLKPLAPLRGLAPLGLAPASAVLAGSLGDGGDLRAAFDAMDVSGDGVIQKSELLTAVLKLTPGKGREVLEPLVQQAFNKFDMDFSGSLDYVEFVKLYAEIKPLLGGISDGTPAPRVMVDALRRSSAGFVEFSLAMDAFVEEHVYGQGGESSQSVHSSICSLVSTQAAHHPAWALYAGAFSSPAVQAAMKEALHAGQLPTPVCQPLRANAPAASRASEAMPTPTGGARANSGMPLGRVANVQEVQREREQARAQTKIAARVSGRAERRRAAARKAQKSEEQTAADAARKAQKVEEQVAAVAALAESEVQRAAEKAATENAAKVAAEAQAVWDSKAATTWEHRTVTIPEGRPSGFGVGVSEHGNVLISKVDGGQLHVASLKLGDMVVKVGHRGAPLHATPVDVKDLFCAAQKPYTLVVKRASPPPAVRAGALGSTMNLAASASLRRGCADCYIEVHSQQQATTTNEAAVVQL